MMKKVDFDQYADDYDEIVSSQTKFFTDNDKYFAQYKVDILHEVSNVSVSNILEYGCGTGRNIPYITQSFIGATVVGADLSEKSIDIARRHNISSSFELIDSTFFDRIGTFDLVFIAGVYHHVAPALRKDLTLQISKLIRKGGSIVIFEHNPLNPITRKLVRECPFDSDAVLISMPELIKEFKQAGLRVRSKGFTLFFPPKFKWLLSLEKYMRWLPIGGQYYIVLEHD